VTSLDTLLELQEHDLALDRLRHRRETLPERAALATAEAQVAALQVEHSSVVAARDEVLAEERRLDHEAQSFSAQAAEHERRLYSGEIASPRDLQALQADVQGLRRRQRETEDLQLATMERREPLEGEVARVAEEIERAEGAVVTAHDALIAAEAEIDREADGERAVRDELAAGIDVDLLADYEQRRAKAKGVGAARLVGTTCQGCHLTIPATEVDRIRKAPEGTVEYCDNCGAILVP
jgi:hypothetical protein